MDEGFVSAELQEHWKLTRCLIKQARSSTTEIQIRPDMETRDKCSIHETARQGDQRRHIFVKVKLGYIGTRYLRK